MIEKNNIWELVAIPREREVASLKRIYKIKLNQEGDIQSTKQGWLLEASRKNQVLIFMKLSLQWLILRKLEL